LFRQLKHHCNDDIVIDSAAGADLRSRSAVWKYFVPQDNAAFCKLCQRSLKRTRGNTSNLFHHLKRSHVRQYGVAMTERSRRTMKEATRNMVR